MTHKHLSHYILLVLGLVVTMLLFIYFKYNPAAQTIVAGVGALYYISWGLIHHGIEGRLDKAVLLEYVLFGIIVFALVFASIYFL
ncbi:MAG: hypothetical protein ACOZAO_03005 [Patescibacteria group bacterium]